MKKSLEEVRAFFANDKFAANNGAVIEAFDDGYARCSIELNENHLNAAGGVQGGVHYMLSDFTFAVATNWDVCGTVSLHGDIAYLGAVKGRKMIADFRYEVLTFYLFLSVLNLLRFMLIV